MKNQSGTIETNLELDRVVMGGFRWLQETPRRKCSFFVTNRHCINCQLEREGAWKRKSSTAVQCQAILNQISQTTAIPSKESCPNVYTRRLQTKKVKAVGKKLISESFAEQANSKADDLSSQGALARLLAEEKKDIP